MTYPSDPAELTPEGLDQMTQAWANMQAEFAAILSHYASWRAQPDSMLHPLILDDQFASYLEHLDDPDFKGQAQALILAALSMLYDLAPEPLRMAWAADGHHHD